ncbi:DinB family protein [Amycolatopsis ultiminotia]|uniref:DinB family protein n=1 Tax=Amycolatopsis ultiminotia TaxID=543629 RepID=UPI0031E6269C
MRAVGLRRVPQPRPLFRQRPVQARHRRRLVFAPAVTDTGKVDRQAVHDEMELARARFHQFLDQATDADLRRASDGTRWTNRELLFHLLLGYLIVWALRNLVRLLSRLPDRASQCYARILNAATVPFDAVNYAGSRLGGALLSPRRMAALADRAIARLHRSLDRETDADLARAMHFPTRWDPFFHDRMTSPTSTASRPSTSTTTSGNSPWTSEPGSPSTHEADPGAAAEPLTAVQQPARPVRFAERSGAVGACGESVWSPMTSNCGSLAEGQASGRGASRQAVTNRCLARWRAGTGSSRMRRQRQGFLRVASVSGPRPRRRGHAGRRPAHRAHRPAVSAAAG